MILPAHFQIPLRRVENIPGVWYWALIPEGGNVKGWTVCQLKKSQKSTCFIWQEIHNLVFHTAPTQAMKMCKKAWNGTFFFTFGKYIITPRKTLVMPSPWLREQKMKARRIRPFFFLPIVHWPKCVWSMEMQTKPTANSMRLTLDKYNSQPVMCHAP